MSTKHDIIYCTVYVGDCALFASDQKLIDWLLAEIQKEYRIESFGKLQHLLGVEINHQKDGSLVLTQEKYIEKMLKTYKMDECNPTRLPSSPEHRLTKEMEATTEEEIAFMKDKNYRQLVGSLLYMYVNLIICMSCLSLYLFYKVCVYYLLEDTIPQI